MNAMVSTFSPLLTVWFWASQNWAALAIAGTCLSLVAFLVLCLGKYVRISLNIFTDTPLPMSMGPLDFERLQGEEVRFRSFDGTNLRGMWLRPPRGKPRRGAILFCHEFGSDLYSCVRYLRPLIEEGFTVFTFDFRGHGESSCPAGYRLLQWPSDKELEDVLGACAYVEDSLAAVGESERIGVFGISRGAGAAILAASSDPNIACLVSDGAFSTRETLVSYMKKWAHIFAKVKLVYENHPEAFWRFMLWCMLLLAQPKLGRRFPSITKALREMAPRPILFIHGQRDSYIRSDQARLLYQSAGEPSYLWIVPGAKHNQSVAAAPGEYARRTSAFLRKYLAGEEVSEAELEGQPTQSDVA